MTLQTIINQDFDTFKILKNAFNSGALESKYGGFKLCLHTSVDHVKIVNDLQEKGFIVNKFDTDLTQFNTADGNALVIYFVIWDESKPLHHSFVSL